MTHMTHPKKNRTGTAPRTGQSKPANGRSPVPPWVRYMTFLIVCLLAGGIFLVIHAHQEATAPGTETNYPDGSPRYRVKEVDGEFDGRYVEYYQSGVKKIVGQYVAGKREGQWTTYNEAGAKDKIVKFKNDKMHGKVVAWWGKETIQETGNFKNGRRDGAFKKYYLDGALRSKIVYKDGKRISKETYPRKTVGSK